MARLKTITGEEYAAVFDLEDEAIVRDISVLNKEMIAAGVKKFACGLSPATQAISLRPQPDGGVLVTDGPYLEAKEHVGGFSILAEGPAAGLDAVDRLTADPALARYHLLPSVRGDLLTKMGRFSEARQEIQRAIAMTQNLREQQLQMERLKQIEKAAT